MADLGPRCAAVGLTADNFQNEVANGALLTNGIMLELYDCKIALKGLCQMLTIPEFSLKSNIQTLRKNVVALKKSIGRNGVREQLDTLLGEAFVMPVTANRQDKDVPKRVPSSKPCQNCINLLETNSNLQERNSVNLTRMEEMYKEKISELEGNIKHIKRQNKVKIEKLQVKNDELNRKNEKLQTKLNKVYVSVGGYTERKHIFRKINQLKESSNRWSEEYHQLKRKHEKLKGLYERRRKDERNRRLRISRYLRRSASAGGEDGKELITHSSIIPGWDRRNLETARKDNYHESMKKVRQKPSTLSEQEQQERSKTEDIIDGVLDNGLWEEREQIMTNIENMSQARQRDVLQNQILFRTLILGCDLGKHSIAKTPTEDLVALLANNQIPDDDIAQIIRNPCGIIGREFRHKWEDAEELWYHGRILRMEDGVYAIEYDNNMEVFYVTISEFLTDLHLNDISLDAYMYIMDGNTIHAHNV